MKLFSLGALALGLLVSVARADIRVENLGRGAILRYPVAFLSGTVTAPNGAALPDGTPVTLLNSTSKRADARYQTTLWKGRFKVLTQLVAGAPNALELRCGDQKLAFPLSYRPQTTTNVTRVIYYLSADGDTRYQTPDPNDPQNFRARISTALKLMQTYCAEEMNRAGYGRRTFALQFGPDGEVEVQVVRSQKPDAYFFENPKEVADRIYRDADSLLAKYPTQNARNLVFSVINRKTVSPGGKIRWEGAGAVGSWYSGNAIFHTRNLFEMPATLAELPQVLLDTRRVPGDLVYDDSGNRGTYWGGFGTGFGVLLHEMGHAWSLNHRDDRFTIMSRGFDQSNRFFATREPEREGGFLTATPQNTSSYRLEQLQRLAYSQWFELDARPDQNLPAPGAQLDAKSDELVISAPAGLRVIGIDADRQFLRQAGDYSTFQNEGIYTVTNVRADQIETPIYAPLAYDEAKPPHRVVIPRAKLARFVGTDAFTLILVDAAGHIARVDAAEIVAPRLFWREWQILKTPRDWADSSRLPGEISPAQIEALTRELRAQPLIKSEAAALDLGAFFGGNEAKNQGKIAYVLATIQSPTARRVLLKTGSDDSLRVWANGHKIGEKYAFRGASPDSDVFPLELQAGTNEILFEVANRDFGWGLIARLTLENAPDNPLAIGVGGAALGE